MSIDPSATLGTAQLHLAASLYALKKAEQIPGDAVLQLLQSMPQGANTLASTAPSVNPSSNPPNLGKNIDVTA